MRRLVLSVAVLATLAIAPAPAVAEYYDVAIVAGNGEVGHGGDGGPGTDAQFADPRGIDVSADGTVTIADAGDEGRIRVISPGGTISSRLVPGPSSPVGEAFEPIAVAARGGGSFYAFDNELGAVYNDAGTVVVGGNSNRDPEQEPEPDADEDERCNEHLVIADGEDHGSRSSPFGEVPVLLLVDQRTNQDSMPGNPGRVFTLTPVPEHISAGPCNTWRETRVAGGGPAPPGNPLIAPSGDGQRAEEIYIDEPTAVASLRGLGGGFLVASAGRSDCRIRRVTGTGIVQTVAGIGLCVRDPLGSGQATAVPINEPHAVAATPDGGFVFIETVDGPTTDDPNTTALRRVAPDGTMTDISSLSSPEPGPLFADARGIVATPDGDILVTHGQRILRIDTNFAAPPDPPAPVPEPPPTPHPNPNPNPLPPPGGDEPTPQPKLGAALGKAAYKVRKGKKLTLKFKATQPGSYRLDVLKGKKRHKRVTGAAKRGTNTITVRLKLKPARYKLALELRVAGKSAGDTAKLTIKRP